MMSNLSELFNGIIHSDYFLKRINKNWLLKNGQVITLRSPNRHACGFSLDSAAKKPFQFISSHPPESIAKMCDAIIVLSYKNKDYVFIIEKKTSNRDDYKLQLINGKHFCDWMIALLKQHKHYDQDPTYIGLLCLNPSSTSNKEQTTHRNTKIYSETPCLLMPHFNKFSKIGNDNPTLLSWYL